MAAFLLSLFQKYHLHVISATTTTSQRGCTAYCTVIETIKFPWLSHVYIYSYIYWLNSPPQWGTIPPWGEPHSLPYKDSWSWPIRMRYKLPVPRFRHEVPDNVQVAPSAGNRHGAMKGIYMVLYNNTCIHTMRSARDTHFLRHTQQDICVI